jgi:hypothetical protein
MNGIERERVGPLPIWGWAAGTGLLVWLLYVVTLAPTTGFWDTSEYIATAYIVGLPHPPGNPLFVLVGRVWILLLEWTGLSIAARINLLSATLSAGTAFLWFLTVVRIWAHFTEDRRQLLITGFVAVLVSATAYTVWAQSNMNEKVYTLSLFVVALVSYLAMLWEDETDNPRGDRLLVLIAFLLGLGAANHTMSVLPLPALGVFVLWHSWRTLLRWKLVTVALVFLGLGYSVQILFVPIRSAQNPIIDEADPQCESVIEAVTPGFYTDARGKRHLAVRCDALASSLVREQYGKPSALTERQAPITAQYANFWQYFDWQWAYGLGRTARPLFTMLFLFFGMVGLWQHWRGDRDSFVYFSVLTFTVTLALVFYLNFRYGYSLYNDLIPNTDLHEVRERDYFYVIGFNVWGLYAGLGLVTLWRQLAEGRGGDDRSPRYAQASPVLLVALVPLLLNWSAVDRKGDYSARDWAWNLLQSAEPYAVLFTNGDNDTFPLWYLQEVEGIRRDVTVIVHSYLGTTWYPKQIRELTTPCPAGVDPLETETVVVCQRPFDMEAAVGPYRGMEITPPTRSVIALTDEQIEALPPGYIMPTDTTLAVSDWVTADVREGELITFPDILVLHIVQQAMGDRPVYFAATAPPVYGRWRLQPHLLRQGMAHKVVHGLLESAGDTVFVGGQLDIPWVDRQRTQELLWDVFQVDYLLDWDTWPEPSTRSSIPAQYYLAYMALTVAHELREDPDEADRAFARAERLLQLSDLVPAGDGGGE